MVVEACLLGWIFGFANELGHGAHWAVDAPAAGFVGNHGDEAQNSGGEHDTVKAKGKLCRFRHASEFFFENKVPEEKVYDIYNELVRNKKNIVLIGMPASGKTTVGNILAGES